MGVNGEAGKITLRSLKSVIWREGRLRKDFELKQQPRFWKVCVFKSFFPVTTFFPTISNEGISVFPQDQDGAYMSGFK